MKLPEKIGKNADSRHGAGRSGARSAHVRHCGGGSGGKFRRSISPAERIPGKDPDDYHTRWTSLTTGRNCDKDYLQGEAKEEWMPLRSEKFFQNRGIELISEKRVTGVDIRTKSIEFETGESSGTTGCCWQRGVSPRKLDVPGENTREIFTLRSFNDSRAIVKPWKRLRAVIVGASFIGLESASSLRKRGSSVTVVAPEAVPSSAFWARTSARCSGGRMKKPGWHSRLEQGVERFEGTDAVQGCGAEKWEQDRCGPGPDRRWCNAETGYLKMTGGNGRQCSDRSYFRVAEDVYAAGDIARVPGWRNGEYVRIEHWRTAEQQGRDAALNMAGRPTANAGVPFFLDQAG